MSRGTGTFPRRQAQKSPVAREARIETCGGHGLP